MKEYLMQDITISNSDSKIFEGVSDLLFTNQGTAAVTINSTTLNTGDTLSHPAFGDEINKTNYIIKFGSVGTKILVVTQKIYTKH